MTHLLKRILCSGGLLALLAAGPVVANGISAAPPELVSALAESTAGSAAHDPAYAIDGKGCASLNRETAAALAGCFGHHGPRFTSGDRTVGLKLVAFGRAGHLQPVELQREMPHGNRVEYAGRGLREWWRVLPLGYEQGFTLERAPAGRGEVALEMTASATPTTESDGSLTWGGVHYGKLLVTDAGGKRLPAHMTAQGRTIRLAFDVNHARFPVTVDPLVWGGPKITASDGAASDEFGYAVALSSDGATALVGAHRKPNGTLTLAGAAYIFTRGAGGTWSQAAKLTPNDPAANDFFGAAVALSADGTTALVGAYWKDVGGVYRQGAAYIFTRPVAGWASTSTPTAKLTAGDGATDDWFGEQVALAPDGSVALVSAIQQKYATGAVYLYVKPGGGWATSASHTAKLTGSDVLQDDRFGEGVALTNGGAVVLVGAPQQTVGSQTHQGAAYFFIKGSGNTWPQTAKLVASDGTGHGYFGDQIAFSGDGNTAVVSSLSSAYVYTKPAGGWSGGMSHAAKVRPMDGTGGGLSSVGLSTDGLTLLLGSATAWVRGVEKQGAAYLFQASAGWTSFSEKVWMATMDGGLVHYFGNAVALSGDGATALIGSYADDPGGNGHQGSVYAFRSLGISYEITPPATVLQGTQYAVPFQITNSGTSASDNLVVYFTTFSGATYVSGVVSQGSCDAGVATCTIGSVAAGATVTGTLTLAAAAYAGTITHKMDVTTPSAISSTQATTAALAHITYDGNGSTSGTAPVDSATYGSGATATVLGPGTLARAGYYFAGWSINADGSSGAYAPGDTLTVYGNVTLYAQWTSSAVHVTYNGNKHSGGTVPADAHDYNAGDTVTVLGAGDMVRDGCVFTGWNTDPGGGGTAYAAGATFTIAADTTLYAQWAVAPTASANTASGGGGGGGFELAGLAVLGLFAARRRRFAIH